MWEWGNAYKNSKNPDTYFCKHEGQIILYGGARRMPAQAGIPLKGRNIDKRKAEYQELTAQKKELTATYKNCEKELKSEPETGEAEPVFRTHRAAKKRTGTARPG